MKISGIVAFVILSLSVSISLTMAAPQCRTEGEKCGPGCCESLSCVGNTCVSGGSGPTPPSQPPPSPTPPSPTPPSPSGCIDGGQGQPCSSLTNCCAGVGSCTKGNPGQRVCLDPPPTMSPVAPLPPGTITYKPGELTRTLFDARGDRMLVSAGMLGKTICGGGGGQDNCHCAADAGACFLDPNDPTRFYYVSNGECSQGGVWSFHFDSAGNNLMGDGKSNQVLDGTNWNCGGGKTPWGTWLSSEENGDSGRVCEVDPAGSGPGYQTNLVDKGSNYESNAYYDGTQSFFTTDDRDLTTSDGQLVRCNTGPNFSKSFGGLANACVSHSFLVLNAGTTQDSGTYTFENSRGDSPVKYNKAEGIDVVRDSLYFVTKGDKHLYHLDLAGNTWNRTSTVSGAFNNQPDQIRTILNEDGTDGILYFCEDGGSDCGVHGRDSTGQFFSIVDAPDYNTESTGFAMSPDGQYMFVSFQDYAIWMFWREDGYPFNGATLDIKYHAT